MGGGETAAEGGRIITMVRRFWGPAPPQKVFGASPLNSLNLSLYRAHVNHIVFHESRSFL